MTVGHVVLLLSLFSSSAKADARAEQDARFARFPSVVQRLPRCSDTEACPVGVDPDFVLTPSGWFHPSCIVAISNDEIFDREFQLIENVDGTTRNVEPCGFEPRDRRGNVFRTSESTRSRTPTTYDNTWLATIANGQKITGGVTLIDAYWTVPKAPVVTSSSVTIYMFPGVKKDSAGNIIQPVLGWNAIDSYGTLTGNKWTINSWDCCVNNQNVMNTTPLDVSPGQTIHGYASGYNCSASTKVCTGWTVSIDNGTNGVFAQVNGNTLAFGTDFGDVVGGTLETYGIDSCAKLPASLGAMPFT